MRPLLPRPRTIHLSGKRLKASSLHCPDPPNPTLAEAVRRTNLLFGDGDKADREGGAPLRLDLADPEERPPSLDADESYELRISPAGVAISARETFGVLHALTTVAQLADREGCLPAGLVQDAPCFPWRGLMLDPARRFISMASLHKTLDIMAFYKLNVLHLHLTDDQGFRWRSTAFPKLASSESYSAQELRGLVAQAALRGIRVIPELDMPGHVTSWLCAYPQWGPQGAAVPHTDNFGPHEAVLNPADEQVYQALEILLGELADIFPDPFVHVGGDEVNPKWWSASEQVAAYMAQQGLADPAALQVHFLARVARFAAARGKRVLAWDEALHDQGPADMVVQAWRGATAQGRALAQGHDCVTSSAYYLDLFYPADLHQACPVDAAEDELLAWEDSLIGDPRLGHVSAGLKWLRGWRRQAEGPPRARILGAEACLWSELVSEEIAPVRLWSRMPALADRFWADRKAPEDRDALLTASLKRLADAGILDVLGASRALLRKFGVAERQIPAVELLEPVKWYARLLGEQALAARTAGTGTVHARPYQVATPLNRPVDALPPESFAARQFAKLLNRGGEPLREQCARRLSACNAGAFLPELQAPIRTLAHILSTLLALLDGRMAPATAETELAGADAPHGEYLVAIALPAQQWRQTLTATLRRDQGVHANRPS